MISTHRWFACCLLLALVAAACGDNREAPGADDDTTDPTELLREKVKTIVVIYAENRGFDNIYGTFPGANGIPSDASKIAPQLDRDGTVLPSLPPTWGTVTASGFTPAITQAMSVGKANAPYALQTVYPTFQLGTITRDLVHRFFENQMQIHDGKNDQYAAYSDAGGLVMGYHDGSAMALWDVARRYVLADNFFMATFGGSFLNHQYLICACAPEYPNADSSPAQVSISALEMSGASYTARLQLASTTPASVLDAAPTYVNAGNLTPRDYFGDGTFRAVNTMQPPYQPSANPSPADDASKLYTDLTKTNTLPPQTATTIGDRLDAKGVSWKWYAGAWTSTLKAATTDRQFPPVSSPGAAPNFQFHHQPFNYYAKFDPGTAASARAAHLDDGARLMADIAAGTLPDVVFYKPEGDLNQHAGYASIQAGDQHIADLIGKLEASPQFASMVIVVTYDENGGWWDHVAPPKGDLLGPGTRIPAIIISPLARAGTVDHTQYDTASIQRLINRRFDLAPLPGITARDAALAAAGGEAMGDLTAALDLTK